MASTASPRRLQRASSSIERGRIGRAGTGGILGSGEMSPQLGRASSDSMPASEFSPTGRLATTDFALPIVVERIETQALVDPRDKLADTDYDIVPSVTERNEVQALIDEIDADIAKTLPILASANERVGCLTKKDIIAVLRLASPPKDIINVMTAVLTVLGIKNADWTAVKKKMSDPNFMNRIICLDKDNMPDKVMKKVETFTRQDNFLPQIMM